MRRGVVPRVIGSVTKPGREHYTPADARGKRLSAEEIAFLRDAFDRGLSPAEGKRMYFRQFQKDISVGGVQGRFDRWRAEAAAPAPTEETAP